MNTERERPKEADLPSRRARIFFVRHGEPVEYGSDTALSPRGVNQVEEFADYFVNELAADEHTKIVKILRSDRMRTDETAEIISKRVHDGIRSGELDFVSAKENIRKRHFISPNNTLDPLINAGVPLNEAYREWLSLNHQDAAAIGTKWSGDIAEEAFHLTHLLGSVVADSPIGPDL